MGSEAEVERVRIWRIFFLREKILSSSLCPRQKTLSDFSARFFGNLFSTPRSYTVERALIVIVRCSESSLERRVQERSGRFGDKKYLALMENGAFYANSMQRGRDPVAGWKFFAGQPERQKRSALCTTLGSPLNNAWQLRVISSKARSAHRTTSG